MSIQKVVTILLIFIVYQSFFVFSQKCNIDIGNLSADDIQENIDFWSHVQQERFLNESINDLLDLIVNGKPNQTEEQICFNSINSKPPEYFDYIIVGGSESGPVLGSRLTEMSDHKIFYLNTVEYLEEEDQVPFFFTLLQYKKKTKILTEATPGIGEGLTNQKPVIGFKNKYGTIGSIVDTITNRGDPDNYRCVEGFEYEELLPYFLKTEGANLSDVDPAFHNFDGPIGNNYAFNPDIYKYFLNASEELGYKNIDYNSCPKCGTSRAQAQIKNGKIVDINKVYLKQCLYRKNFKMDFGRPIKILIESKKAVGIQYVKNFTVYTALAKKEIILAHGCLNTPKLLLLSGIGPKKDLDNLNIPVVLDNSEVGCGIHDCIASFGYPLVGNASDLLLSKNPLGKNSQKEYLYEQSGPLTNIASIEAFAKIKGVDDDCSRIWLKLCAYYISTSFGNVIFDLFGIDPSFKEFLNTIDEQSAFCLVPAINPKSGGCLRLKSSHPCDDPVIKIDYLKDPDDLENMLRQAYFITNLTQTKVFKDRGIKLHNVPLPGCKHFWGKKNYHKCVIEKYFISTQDPTGGASFGKVTDKNCKLLGVDGIRICDQSILPNGLTGPTRTFATMLGEFCADLIKKECGVTPDKCHE